MSEENQDKDRGRAKPWKTWKQHKLEHLHRMQFGQRGFLRPEIIGLFEEQPMNGVEIMDRLQEMSRGWYRPSPGSIYPLLVQLEKEGLITKNEEGKYELTAAFSERAGIGNNLTSALSALESNTSYLEDLQRTDSARLAKYKERVERLTRRLEALSGGVQSKGGQP